MIEKYGTFAVAPFMGAWIEIDTSNLSFPEKWVAPFMGAWIEIIIMYFFTGLLSVAPFMGAWIEICTSCRYQVRCKVAPFMGAWIEIDNYTFLSFVFRSLPSWERGLKFNNCILIIAITCRSLHGSVD